MLAIVAPIGGKARPPNPTFWPSGVTMCGCVRSAGQLPIACGVWKPKRRNTALMSTPATRSTSPLTASSASAAVASFQGVAETRSVSVESAEKSPKAKYAMPRWLSFLSSPAIAAYSAEAAEKRVSDGNARKPANTIPQTATPASIQNLRVRVLISLGSLRACHKSGTDGERLMNIPTSD